MSLNSTWDPLPDNRVSEKSETPHNCTSRIGNAEEGHEDSASCRGKEVIAVLHALFNKARTQRCIYFVPCRSPIQLSAFDSLRR